MFSPTPPVYSYEIKTIGTTQVLCIVDHHGENCPSLTVTNGAELVLREIAKEIGTLPHIIIYKDSDGIWDRIKARPDGHFLGFSPIAAGNERPTNDQEALTLAVTSVQPFAQLQ